MAIHHERAFKQFSIALLLSLARPTTDSIEITPAPPSCVKIRNVYENKFPFYECGGYSLYPSDYNPSVLRWDSPELKVRLEGRDEKSHFLGVQREIEYFNFLTSQSCAPPLMVDQSVENTDVTILTLSDQEFNKSCNGCEDKHAYASINYSLEGNILPTTIYLRSSFDITTNPEILRHELGHALGLAHNNTFPNLMERKRWVKKPSNDPTDLETGLKELYCSKNIHITIDKRY